MNLSRIRSSHELLKGGGTASGPVSFMRGADASAGTIKSGGKTRRAAKMVILDADHPDVEDFIWCKAIEERKARVLRDAGFDMDLDGADSHSTQYQNANNSVRVTDEFMQAVLDGADWHLTARTDGSVVRTVQARDLFRQIAHAAWECADPGMQFDTTINEWHTAPNAGRINGSNPCFPGSAMVHTDKGLIPFPSCSIGPTRARPSASTPTTPPIPRRRRSSLVDVARGLHDHGLQRHCSPALRQRHGASLHARAQDLHDEPRLRRSSPAVFTDEVKLLDLQLPPSTPTRVPGVVGSRRLLDQG